MRERHTVDATVATVSDDRAITGGSSVTQDVLRLSRRFVRMWGCVCVCETGPMTTTFGHKRRRPSISDKAVKTKWIDDDFENDDAALPMSRPSRCQLPDLSSLLGREDDEPRS